jgi:hypothetical protein
MKTITYVNDTTKTDIILNNPRFALSYPHGFSCLVGEDSSNREIFLDIHSEAEFNQGLELGIIRAPIRL